MSIASHVRHGLPIALPPVRALVLCCLAAGSAASQLHVIPRSDSVLDADSLVLGSEGSFGRIINVGPYQQDLLISHGDYQYAAWYHNGPNDENIFVSRRHLLGTTWETIDTGYTLENGDGGPNPSPSQRWDSHNSISMGISGDGRLHLAYDHHVDELRYLTTGPGVASGSGGVWNAAIFSEERNALNVGGSRIPQVTYPRFTNHGDDLYFSYRERSSSDGDHYLARYDATDGLWGDTRQFTDGRVGTHIDIDGNPSERRNAYLNGIDVDPLGRMHTTWTWRESSQIGNHDLNYAYSDNGGVTWRNNAGQAIGTPSTPISLESPGIEVVDLNYQQGLINQQGQVVDHRGGVHVVAFHRRQEPGFEWEPGDSRFDRDDAAYHHYYRDPGTGAWDVNRLPVGERVGSRPQVGVDREGNAFALYTSGGGDLVIAGADRLPGGYGDWRVLHRDQRDFEGTPLLDQERLFNHGLLSVILQERPTVTFPNAASGSPLRVLEFRTTDQTPTTYYQQASHALGESLVDATLWMDDPVSGATLASHDGKFSGNRFVVDGVSARTPNTAGLSIFSGDLVLAGEGPTLINHSRSLSLIGLAIESNALFAQRVDGQRIAIDDLRLDAELLIRQQLEPGGDASVAIDEIGGVGALKLGLNSLDIDNDWTLSATDSNSDFVGSVLLDRGNLVFGDRDSVLSLATLRFFDDANLSTITLEQNATFKALEQLSTADPDLVIQTLGPGSYSAADLDAFFGTAGRFVGPGTLTLLGEQPLLGDFNGDGAVNAADYTVWRDNLQATEFADTLAGNGDGGRVGGSDYELWASAYAIGRVAGAAAASLPVPEPSVWSQLGIALLVALICARETPVLAGER